MHTKAVRAIKLMSVLSFSAAAAMLSAYDGYPHWLSLSADRTAHRVQYGRPVPEVDVVSALEIFQEALGRSLSITFALDFTAMTMRARRTADATEHQARLLLAEEALLRSLKVAPADSLGWITLAQVRWNLYGPDERLAQAVATSLQMGPYIRAGAAFRLWLGLQALPYFTEVEKILLMHQLRLAYEADRDRARIVIMLRAHNAVEMGRNALAEWWLPEGTPALAHFEAELERQMAR